MRLGEVLIEQKVITEEQLEEALKYQQQHSGIKLGQALISLGFATADDIDDALFILSFNQ